MKNIKALKKENEQLILKHKPKFVKTAKGDKVEAFQTKEAKKAANKARKQVELNKRIILALESGLTQETLDKQIKEVSGRVKQIEDDYPVWLKATPFMHIGDKPEKTYAKETNLKHFKDQLVFLKNIL